MVQNRSKVEADNRRFDIGSGISLEPLSSNVLEFVFHPRVANKLLGSYSGFTLNKDNTDNNKIYWDKGTGVGIKGNTKEIIFLATNSNDKVAINKILAANGNITSLLNTSDAPDAEERANYETVNLRIDRAISSIGRLINLAVAQGFETIDSFKRDVITNKTIRLTALNTVGTNQSRLIAFSHSTGVFDKDIRSNSHPAQIPVETANKINSTTYSAPFIAQKKLRDSLYDK